jgi:hypothetical protein
MAGQPETRADMRGLRKNLEISFCPLDQETFTCPLSTSVWKKCSTGDQKRLNCPETIKIQATLPWRQETVTSAQGPEETKMPPDK